MTLADEIGSDWTPDWAVHPGEVLEEHLEVRGISQAEFARRADLTPKLVSTIIAGKNPVTAETAIALERVLGMKAYIWTGMQADWDLYKSHVAHKQAADEPAVRAWVDRFPIKDLQARGALPQTRDPAALYDSLLKFFGVASAEGYEARFGRLSVQYRHSATHKSDEACLNAWLQLGELQARHLTLAAYSADRFRKVLSLVRTWTCRKPQEFFPEMVAECASAGVAVVATKPLPKTRLSGAARWLGPERAIIHLSLRHKTNDHFWFSFCHEAGHVLLHKRDVVFADDEGVAGDGIEAEADEFAEDVLVGRERFRAFCARRPRSAAEVSAFSNYIGVHPGIVVGMLQHHRIVSWSHLNGLKDRFEWSTGA
ncbi:MULTISPECIES: HigA family addiction module antitoxin [Pseudomonadota]|uniref:HigA family addiction module antitoxin n=1 Tax=Pseudomonadota TaxID=1224 RepID=UPI0027308A7E|nr:HigA family addiction module antitoxin [Phenylobacterium sp.]MDP1986340.1 HigA family addiction module antitoxin [Phenylobacterium sp.]MDP2370674.1 HigA family addiction module antitoxin [Rhodoferax sp.]